MEDPHHDNDLDLHVACDSDGSLLVRLERFDARRLARIRAIPGRRWEPELKAWRLPRTAEAEEALRREFPNARPARPPDHAKAALEALREEMVLEGFSPRTRKVYLAHVRSFLRWRSGKPAREATAEDVRSYLLHLVE